MCKTGLQKQMKMICWFLLSLLNFQNRLMIIYFCWMLTNFNKSRNSAKTNQQISIFWETKSTKISTKIRICQDLSSTWIEITDLDWNLLRICWKDIPLFHIFVETLVIFCEFKLIFTNLYKIFRFSIDVYLWNLLIVFEVYSDFNKSTNK